MVTQAANLEARGGLATESGTLKPCEQMTDIDAAINT